MVFLAALEYIVRIRTCLIVGLTAVTASLAPNATSYGGDETPRIVLEQFHIEPTTITLGEPFTIHARAATTGVSLGSFILRTTNEVPKENKLKGFPLYANGKYYVAERGKYFLIDNGDLDQNPQENALALQVGTRGWKPGKYVFSFFASCRPSPGPFRELSRLCQFSGLAAGRHKLIV